MSAKKSLGPTTECTVSRAPIEERPGQTLLDTCPYRKSNPDVLVMQSSQERRGNDAASGLDRTRNGCILAQR